MSDCNKLNSSKGEHLIQPKTDSSISLTLDSNTINNNKRRHHTLSIRDKIELLQKVENGVSNRTLCKLYNIGTSTIYGIKHQREQLFKYFKDRAAEKADIYHRKTMKEGKSPELDKALFKWYRRQRSEGIRLTPNMIREQAMILHDQLDLDYECNYSDGWLQRFKQRHGLIKSRSIAIFPKEEMEESDFSRELIPDEDHLTADHHLVINADNTPIKIIKVRKYNVKKYHNSEDEIPKTNVWKCQKTEDKNMDKTFTDDDQNDTTQIPIGRLIQLCSELIKGLEARRNCISKKDMLHIYKLENKLIQQRINELGHQNTNNE